MHRWNGWGNFEWVEPAGRGAQKVKAEDLGKSSYLFGERAGRRHLRHKKLALIDYGGREKWMGERKNWVLEKTVGFGVRATGPLTQLAL